MLPPRPTFRFPPISPAAGAPLYQQIVDGFRREIGEGRIAPGAALPSFRALAEELMVSLITVKRAYEELEREGLIYSRQGLGTFVSEDGRARGVAGQQARARELLHEALGEAAKAGLSRGEISQMIRNAFERTGEDAS